MFVYQSHIDLTKVTNALQFHFNQIDKLLNWRIKINSDKFIAVPFTLQKNINKLHFQKPLIVIYSQIKNLGIIFDKNGTATKI